MIKESFGERLTKLLADAGMAQLDLVRLTGFRSGTISAWCNDKCIPSIEAQKKIAKALNISYTKLVHDVEFVIKRRESYITFGQNLKRLLIKNKMSASELARRIDVTLSSISGYVRGRNLPSDITFNRIITVLNVSRDELLKGCNFEHQFVTSLHYTPKSESEYGKETIKKYSVPKTPLEPLEIDFTPMESISTNVVIPRDSIIGNQKICTKCMYDNVTDCVVNSMFSYSPDTIQKWARRSICRMTDIDSLEYNPDRAVMIQEMLFKFFINKKKPLRPDSRYFIREKDGEMFLKRNKGELDTLHNYSISRRDENGKTHVTRMVMSEAEKAKVEDILNELSIDFVVRDLADILK